MSLGSLSNQDDFHQFSKFEEQKVIQDDNISFQEHFSYDAEPEVIAEAPFVNISDK